MNDRKRDGESTGTGGSELTEAWAALHEGLSAQLRRMTDGDHLIVELPDGHDGETTPYAQFAGFGEGTMLRAELGGDVHLGPAYELTPRVDRAMRALGWQGNDDEEPNWFIERPVDRAERLAGRVLIALRRTYAVAHPQLLTYRAWGPHAEGAVELGLSATGEVPVELPQAPEPLVFRPTDRDDLFAMVRRVLHAKFDEEPTVDDDGDFVLERDGELAWVRVRPDSPVVEVVTRVVHGVWSRRSTTVELSLLNRDNPLVTWSLRERDVWMEVAIPALPFAPDHLDSMVGLFFHMLSATRDDLALRTRGEAG